MRGYSARRNLILLQISSGAGRESDMTSTAALVYSLMLAAFARPAAAQDLNAVLANARRGSQIPAMSVLLIQKGKVAGEAATGVRSLGGGQPVTTRDVWHIGSDGKAMTATMIARLVDRGVLSWKTPLAKLLPTIATDMQPAYRAVTLRDLLSHQAGLQANVDMAVLDASRHDTRPMHVQRLAYARIALSQQPAYQPGTGNIYSNNGVVIAATVAEQVTSLSYEDLMRREVFVPLRMTSAAFGPTGPGQPLGHDHGKPQTGPDADNPPVIAPVGEIHLSMADWARFAIDQLEGESGQGRLLRTETYRFLHTAGRPGSEFALGWDLTPTIGGVAGPFLTHAGSNTLWYAVIVLEPRTLGGVLVAANAGQDAGADKAEGAVVKALLPFLGTTPGTLGER